MGEVVEALERLKEPLVTDEIVRARAAQWFNRGPWHTMINKKRPADEQIICVKEPDPEGGPARDVALPASEARRDEHQQVLNRYDDTIQANIAEGNAYFQTWKQLFPQLVFAWAREDQQPQTA